MPIPIQKDLQIEEDMPFQKIQWVLQRIGRLLIFAFLVAAGFGAFGTGIFSKQTVSRDGLTVTYERFGRLQKSTFFEIRMDETQKFAGQAQRKLWINNEFLKDIMVEYIDPEPSSVQAASDGHTYVFETQGAGDPVSAFFHFRPERPGRHTAVIRADEGAAEISIKQRIYP